MQNPTLWFLRLNFMSILPVSYLYTPKILSTSPYQPPYLNLGRKQQSIVLCLHYYSINNLNSTVHTTFKVCDFSTFSESNSNFIIYIYFQKLQKFKMKVPPLKSLFIFFEVADTVSKMMNRLHDASDVGFLTDSSRINDQGSDSSK